MEYNPTRLFYRVEITDTSFIKKHYLPFITYHPNEMTIFYKTSTSTEDTIVAMKAEENQVKWQGDSIVLVPDDLFEQYFNRRTYMSEPIEFLAKLNLDEYKKLLKLIDKYSADISKSLKGDSFVMETVKKKVDSLLIFKGKFIDWFIERKIDFPTSDIPVNHKKEKIKRNLLRWDGAKWFIRFNGIEKSVDNIKGMHIIAHLISQQGSSIRSDVIYDDLFANIIDKDKIRSDMFEDDLMKDEGLSNGANNTEKIKYVTRKSITIINNERIKREDELEKALIEQDNHLAEKKEWELKELNDWLGKYSDNQGRPRKIPDRLERARKALFGVITTAKNNIKKYHSDVFYNHLDNYLKTGGYSTYHPKTPVDWEVIK